MSLLRAAFKSAIHSLPVGSVARIAGKDLVAPCYHMVTDESPLHTRHLYRQRAVAEFKNDLDHLLKYFKPLSLNELSGLIIAGVPLPEKSLFLSFDDGFREMSEIVADICRQKGVPATFFLTTGFLDNRILGFRQKASLLIEACRQQKISPGDPALKPLADALGPVKERSWDVRRMFLSIGYRQKHILDECATLLQVDFEGYLRAARPYLTGDQVTRLLDDGFSIGGHSVDHPLYADLTLDEQVSQTLACIEELKSRFRLPVRAFAFPFLSDGVDEQFFEQVFGRDIVELAFCIGRMPKSHAAKAIQRFAVESEEQNCIQDLLSREVEGRLRQRLFAWKTRDVAQL